MTFEKDAGVLGRRVASREFCLERRLRRSAQPSGAVLFECERFKSKENKARRGCADAARSGEIPYREALDTPQGEMAFLAM